MTPRGPYLGHERRARLKLAAAMLAALGFGAAWAGFARTHAANVTTAASTVVPTASVSGEPPATPTRRPRLGRGS